MRLRSLGVAALTAVAAALPAALAAEPLVIVVSSDWERAVAIELADLRAVYLGRRTQLFGVRVRRIDLPPGSHSRAGFSQSVLGRPEEELERYWVEQALTGGALPPRQVAAPEDVIAEVKSRIGVIGYLPASDLAGQSKAGIRAVPILVEGVAKRAADVGYPAHTDTAGDTAGSSADPLRQGGSHADGPVLAGN